MTPDQPTPDAILHADTDNETNELENTQRATESAEDTGTENTDTENTDTDATDAEATAEIETAKAAFESEDEEDQVEGDQPESQEATAEESLSGDSSTDTEEDDEQCVELAQPFVGQWNQLISTTNWEKGRIISDCVQR